jgi:hypothetical protein
VLCKPQSSLLLWYVLEKSALTELKMPSAGTVTASAVVGILPSPSLEFLPMPLLKFLTVPSLEFLPVPSLEFCRWSLEFFTVPSLEFCLACLLHQSSIHVIVVLVAVTNAPSHSVAIPFI